MSFRLIIDPQTGDVIIDEWCGMPERLPPP